ncbi:hypothetical protein AX774_g4487 [Zancudomyces culisetae]|uniref:Uncharacterized protein n=1 Tax=Zancudomyces culisetae TaxID=1213189 RepID=A0A1R1PME7_ZANCU|nr:hypothetical protein AX774_g4487 [Zancudomyces culisetae]|eukprot:OMH82052.1 hypothetical protein AX774_g4487 [Zancudomyces culisetae]
MQRLSPQVHSDMALLKHRALDNNDVYIELGPSIRTMNAQRLGVDDMYQAELEELGLANSFLSEEESFSVSPRIDTHQERGYWRLKSLLKFSGFIKGAPGYHWKWLPLVSFGVAMLIGFITLYAYRVEIAKAATVLAVWFKNASTW